MKLNLHIRKYLGDITFILTVGTIYLLLYCLFQT